MFLYDQGFKGLKGSLNGLQGLEGGLKGSLNMLANNISRMLYGRALGLGRHLAKTL